MTEEERKALREHCDSLAHEISCGWTCSNAADLRLRTQETIRNLQSEVERLCADNRRLRQRYDRLIAEHSRVLLLLDEQRDEVSEFWQDVVQPRVTW